MLKVALILNFGLSYWLKSTTEKQMDKTNSRVTFMKECVIGIRVLKLLSWVDEFKKRLKVKRDEEV